MSMMKINQSRPLPHTIYQKNKKSRCFLDQNEDAKAIMLLGENIGEYLRSLGSFLGKDTEGNNHKEKD